MYKYSKRNNPNEGFHYNPLPFPAKFRFVEILPMRIFALAKFRGCEFSLWRNFAGANFRHGEISAKRNFASVDAKFRQDNSEILLTQRKFASALTKIRGEISSNFRENKERKTPNFVCISFAQYCMLSYLSKELLIFSKHLESLPVDFRLLNCVLR